MKKNAREDKQPQAPGERIKASSVLDLTHAYSIYHRFFDPKVVLSEAQGHRMFMDQTDIGVAGPLLQDGIFDPFETKVFKAQLKPGQNIMDVGANIGYFTLMAARGTGEKGKVFSFEPQPHNFILLKKNIRINGYKNIEAFNCAISDKQGKIRLYVDGSNQGAHSLAEGNLIKKSSYIEVKTDTIDNFIESSGLKIDVFKIDTQGAEGLIMEGARKTFSGQGITVIMEFWPWGLKNIGTDPIKLLKEIEEMGFSIKVMDERTQSFPDLSFEEIVRKSYERDNGWGYFNLLLTK